MALLRLAEWVLLSKTIQGCNECSDKTPPALTTLISAQVPLRNLWNQFPPQTQQLVFNALIKMLDQALPATEKEQGDESNI